MVACKRFVLMISMNETNMDSFKKEKEKKKSPLYTTHFKKQTNNNFK
jgi:hypothetical protein